MGTFIPNLSHHTEPLWAMLKKDNVFHWEEQQTWSFQQIKALIAKADNTLLRYYDRNLPKRSRSMSYTEAQPREPAHCLCQQDPHGCRDKVHQHRERTSSHRLCLSMFQHLSTGKELHSRERPQTTGDDCHEEPCECATTSSEDAAGATEIRCHHQVQTTEPNQLADALSHCLVRSSQEIKLDMRVDYIAFMKPWIEKLAK